MGYRRLPGEPKTLIKLPSLGGRPQSALDHEQHMKQELFGWRQDPVISLIFHLTQSPASFQLKSKSPGHQAKCLTRHTFFQSVQQILSVNFFRRGLPKFMPTLLFPEESKRWLSSTVLFVGREIMTTIVLYSCEPLIAVYHSSVESRWSHNIR